MALKKSILGGGASLCHGTGPPLESTTPPLNPSPISALQEVAADRRSSRPRPRRLKVFGASARLACHYKSVGNKQFFEPGAKVTKRIDPCEGKESKWLHVKAPPPPTSGTSARPRKITQRVSIVVRLSDKSTVCVMTALQCWISSCSTPWDQRKAMQTPPGLIIIAWACVRSRSWFVQARMTVFMASRGHTVFIACTV